MASSQFLKSELKEGNIKSCQKSISYIEPLLIFGRTMIIIIPKQPWDILASSLFLKCELITIGDIKESSEKLIGEHDESQIDNELQFLF